MRQDRRPAANADAVALQHVAEIAPSAPGFASACPSHDPARPPQLPRGQHFAGHAGATANLKLTFHPGHSVGANQLAVVR